MSGGLHGACVIESRCRIDVSVYSTKKLFGERWGAEEEPVGIYGLCLLGVDTKMLS